MINLRPKIVDRYLIAEMTPPFLIGVLGFIILMLGDIIFTLMDLIVNKGVPILAVLRLLIYKIPALLILTFPVATLFGTSMAVSRLSQDHEISVLRTSGMSFMRICLPAILFSITVSLFSFYTNEKIVPWTNNISQNIIRQIFLKRPEVKIKEDVFFKDNENRYFYVHKIDPESQKISDLMIYELSSEKLPQVILGQEATWNEEEWDIKNGVIHKYTNDWQLSYEAKFDHLKINVNKDFMNFSEQRTPQEMSSLELKNQIGLLEKGGVSANELKVDYFLKFSIPATCLVFALIGLPLSLPSIRGGKMWGLVLSISIVFLFYFVASIFRSFGRGGVIPPLAGAWSAHLIFGVIGLVLIIREGYFK